MNSRVGTIYCYSMPDAIGTGDVSVFAMAETGEMLATEVALTAEAGRKKLESDEVHARFMRRFKQGYVIEWVDDPADHEGLCAAMLRSGKLSANDADRRA